MYKQKQTSGQTNKQKTLPNISQHAAKTGGGGKCRGELWNRRENHPSLPSLRKCVLLMVWKNNQDQLKREAKPLYDPGRPGGAGPPTRQPLCPVHRGLILICLCISLPWPPLPHGTPRYGRVVSKKVALQGCGAKRQSGSESWHETPAPIVLGRRIIQILDSTVSAT